jgi:hypothetical protein
MRVIAVGSGQIGYEVAGHRIVGLYDDVVESLIALSLPGRLASGNYYCYFQIEINGNKKTVVKKVQLVR